MEIEGQMSLFDEVIEYACFCDECKKVWTSYSPFPENWECPACEAERKRVEEG